MIELILIGAIAGLVKGSESIPSCLSRYGSREISKVRQRCWRPQCSSNRDSPKASSIPEAMAIGSSTPPHRSNRLSAPHQRHRSSDGPWTHLSTQRGPVDWFEQKWISTHIASVFAPYIAKSQPGNLFFVRFPTRSQDGGLTSDQELLSLGQ